jgi:hypothetical protein
MRRSRVATFHVSQLPLPRSATVSGLRFLPQSHDLLVEASGGVSRWEVPGGRLLWEVRQPGIVDALAVSSDARHIAMFVSWREGDELRLLDATTGGDLWAIGQTAGPAYSADFVHGDEAVISLHGYEDEPARSSMVRWNLSHRTPRRLEPRRGNVAWIGRSRVRHPSGGYYARTRSTRHGFRLELRDVLESQTLRTWHIAWPWGAECAWPFLSADEESACISPANAETPAVLVHLDSGTVRELGVPFGGNGRGEVVDFAPDGNLLLVEFGGIATGVAPGAGVWDCRSGERLWSAASRSHRGFSAGRFVCGGTRIALCDARDLVVCESLTGGELMRDRATSWSSSGRPCVAPFSHGRGFAWTNGREVRIVTCR